MSIKILVYGIMLLVSTFAVSGIKINGIFKTNHIWEARFFTGLLIMSITYLSGSLILQIIDVFTNINL
ncbi:MAG: hypothetical protein IKP76_03665 [Bacilli bacterium]|nr:hypothetical protein [Bacilli bacterium]